MYYKNQSVLLASKHEKEQAIANAFHEKLACALHVRAFDTDKFGTFTGEIPRTLSAFETCVLKAKTAASTYGYKLSLASEGSFGPHPAFPFVASDHEIMVFADNENDWVIAEHLITPETNYAMKTIKENDCIDDFLRLAKFPSHALIIQASSNNMVCAKGIKDLESLEKALKLGFHSESELLITTDMRAMMNPTRMQVIAKLADKLATRIATSCLECSRPGFGFKSTHGSLACSLCGSPTSFYEQEVWGCIGCDYIEYKHRSDGLLKADPNFCNYCNP